jgi:hypothetical protein
MTAALNTFTSDGFFVITVPEDSLSAPMRDEFVSAVKAEWLVRQSQMTDDAAKKLAEAVDSDWWQRNRARILNAVGEA